MENTISALQAELEELEKRIKALTNAQNTTSALMAIKEYFESVQNYLSTLKQDFSNHTLCCEEYSTQIQNLQTQIDTINQTLKDGTGSTAQFEALQNQITTLQNDLSALQEQFNTLTQDSSASLQSLETDISTLQTEVGYITDNIEELTAETSSINQTIGEQQTQINNLNSTQNTLTASQSSLSSKVSGIDNRLTTAEANISTLTDGVDVAYLDERISNLEETNGAASAHENYKFRNITPANFTLYTREYGFSCSKNEMLYQKMKLSYEPQGATTLTITFLEEQVETGEQIVVDLKKHPYEFEFTRQFLTTKKANNLMVKVVADAKITYESFDLWLFGKNVFIYNYDQEIKIVCFDNNIYVTRYYDDCIKYGMFASTDEIDIDNLPNSFPWYDTFGTYNYAIYGPYLTATYQNVYTLKNRATFLRQMSSANQYYFGIQTDSSRLATTGVISSSEIYPTYTRFPSGFFIRNSVPKVAGVTISNNIYTYNAATLASKQSGEWLYIAPVMDQYNTLEAGSVTMTNLQLLALNENGYFYFMQGENFAHFTKVGKGTYAKAFVQPDGTITAYLTNGSNVDKYIISQDENGTFFCTFSETITDCFIINEVMGLYLLKQTTSGWVLETIPQTTE